MTPCIEWTGSLSKDGYGVKHMGRRAGKHVRMGAHRWAWQQANGPIPDGLCVLHSCDNPPCVNVEHLWLGTIADNNHDRDRKGRYTPHPPGDQRGEHNTRARLTEAQVKEIIASYKGRSAVDGRNALARRFDVSRSTIDAILQGRNWSHLQKGGDAMTQSYRSASPVQGGQ